MYNLNAQNVVGGDDTSRIIWRRNQSEPFYFIAVLSKLHGFKPWFIKMCSKLDYSLKHINRVECDSTSISECTQKFQYRVKISVLAQPQVIIKYVKKYYY